MDNHDYMPVEHGCDKDSQAIIELIEHVKNDVIKALTMECQFSPEIKDRLIAAHELLQSVVHYLLGALISAYESKRRTADEILAATEEFFDKVWYQRHIDLHFDDNTDEEDIPNEACAAADRIEAKYEGEENLGAYDDFELGMIHGKLAALRWVMGSEWDDLDT